MNIEKEKIKKILIFKLCCLGDIVMLTPVINTLKENFPSAEISMIVCSWADGITGYVGNVDHVIINDDLYKKSFYEKITGVFKLIFTLRKYSFDMVFLGHRNSIFGLILMLSGIKYRLGFMQTEFINYGVPFEENQHEVKRYLNILKSIGIESGIRPIQLKRKYSPDEIKNKFNIKEGKPVIGIFPFGGVNPGTKMNIKRWELSKFYELIKMVINEFPDSRILLFDGTDKEEKNDIEFSEGNVFKFKIDFDLISVCDIMVCCDTGAMHIAAGFNVSTLSIFGPTDPGLLAPLNINSDIDSENKIIHRYIWKKPDCSPCYTPSTAADTKNRKYWKNGTFVCQNGTHICIKEISTEEVFNTLSEMIKRIYG